MHIMAFIRQVLLMEFFIRFLSIWQNYDAKREDVKSIYYYFTYFTKDNQKKEK